VVETGAPPTTCEPVHHLLVVDLIPEVVQMRRYSVVALIHARRDDSDHLALCTAQG
jgi:hypothetical protein